MQHLLHALHSGLGYVVGSSASHLLGDWRWGLRVAPALNLLALALIWAFMDDPERGEWGLQNVEALHRNIKRKPMAVVMLDTPVLVRSLKLSNIEPG